jgi:zinc protease
MRISPLAALALALPVLSACAPRATEAPDVRLEYERFVLDNGLEVILHEDHSDPLAAVAMTFHVGSAREMEGRTGFAHLFEHLFFLDSENLGAGGLDRLMTRIGSSTNGSTSRDRTNYFEVVPVDGLEKALWAEADKLGFFINTVTESVVAKEKQVVKNEKRQSVDNRPYGHTSFVIDEALYPDGHSYRWQVIGSLEDLDAATLEDAGEFHRNWYGPNNATLVVAGDIDPVQTRAWVERYFGEIPSREMPEVREPPVVELTASKRLYHEDRFARLPELTLAWPSVPRFHPDAYALEVLADLLSDGKTTPLYQVLVEEMEVAPDVAAFQGSQELSGRFSVRVRSYDGIDLDRVLAGVDSAFARFQEAGVDPVELQRVMAGTETRFYGGLSSALGKAFQLADYALLADDPGFFQEDLERTLAVTAEDVTRVFRTYLLDRPYVASSFVPQGRTELALEGSERARVEEEPIVPGAEEAFQVVRGEERTPGGSFDRSVEPPFGERPTLTAPEVWRDRLANGVSVLGIEDREIPLVNFELTFRGGLLLEDSDRVGVSQLLAASMTEGTAQRTPEELEQAIDLLGASIAVRAGPETFSISGSTLARNFQETMSLVEEILLEPRYDPEEFELSRQRTLNRLRQRSASPNSVASDVYGRLVYGDHVLGRNPMGTPASVEAITLADLRDFHRRTLLPSLAAYHVVGAVTPEQVMASLEGLATRWPKGEEPDFPEPPAWDPDRAGLYFVDVPDASQSVLSIGYLALAHTDPEFVPAQVMNFRFGGGGFASDLTQELREGKGYTYGIRSNFSGTALPGPFSITSGVRSNITLEALQLVREIMEEFGPTFDESDLEATRSYLLRANARAFETLGAKLDVLRAMSAYAFPADFILQRDEVVSAMTIPEIQRLAHQYLDPEEMVWLVVGDARTQMPRLDALGLGGPTLLTREGNAR